MNSMNTGTILKHLGFSELNDMQISTMKISENNLDLLLLAPTGSGKTLAFVLSALPYLTPEKGIQLLILAPTRELVLQIESVIKAMKLPVKTNVAYGGHAFSVERNNFTEPPTILVGTPGRVEDHLNRKTFKPGSITHIIFDEFDKSLEFGFTNQMESIMRRLPNVERHTLVSATDAISIPDFLNLPNIKKIDFQNDTKPSLSFQQITVPKDEKVEGLIKVLGRLKGGENALVFVNHRDAVERIGEYLSTMDASFAVFHGGLKQEQRELELVKFKNGSANILIATDIAGRGIDIPDLNFVIHYQMPNSNAIFTHRNGRTARMKAEGTVILIHTNEDPHFDYIEDEIEQIQIKDFKPIENTKWDTLYIGKGKKDKINKMDLVGFFLSLDFMTKADLGLIVVKDFVAYVAINSKLTKQVLNKYSKAKIKNKTVKVQLVRQIF